MNPSQSSLEAETQQLLTALSQKKYELQQSDQLQRLYGLRQQIEAEMKDAAWMIAPTDPIWVELEQQKAAIDREIEALTVMAPLSVVQSLSVPTPTLESVDSFDRRTSKASLQGIVAVMVVLLLTIGATGLRLSQTRRFSVSRPFVSSPIEVNAHEW